ncbi:MAG TPA: sulfite exporter TauE/SafE family protein [Bacteroidales bacterium]|nr:sulfite exporter TauE/SafE family protein [Bacteroidales bacterium]HRW96248.1 sulfite exporter TauE/SafE family protein [Bacteroidales bacterium]
MTWFEIISLTVAGILVGFINTLAGGGSIISLAVLMMLGLPPNVANGTNRIGVFFQTLTAAVSFKQKKVLDLRKAFWLSVPAVVGSVIGAWIAVDINEQAFEIAVGIILIIMMFFILYDPSRWISERKELIEARISVKQILIFFLIGLYGGFIQVGVGYFLLAGVVLGAGYELVKANAIKVFVILLYTPFTIIVFLINNQIHWAYGLMMTVGTIAGSSIAAHIAVKKGAKFVQWVIIVVILLTAADLFDFISIKGIILSLKT